MGMKVSANLSFVVSAHLIFYMLKLSNSFRICMQERRFALLCLAFTHFGVWATILVLILSCVVYTSPFMRSADSGPPFGGSLAEELHLET